jgi:hypothetical protein
MEYMGNLGHYRYITRNHEAGEYCVRSTSETSVNVYQTTRRNNPEDSQLHTRRRENLKPHKPKLNSSNNF